MYLDIYWENVSISSLGKKPFVSQHRIKCLNGMALAQYKMIMVIGIKIFRSNVHMLIVQNI